MWIRFSFFSLLRFFLLVVAFALGLCSLSPISPVVRNSTSSRSLRPSDVWLALFIFIFIMCVNKFNLIYRRKTAKNEIEKNEWRPMLSFGNRIRHLASSQCPWNCGLVKQLNQINWLEMSIGHEYFNRYALALFIFSSVWFAVAPSHWKHFQFGCHQPYLSMKMEMNEANGEVRFFTFNYQSQIMRCHLQWVT